MLAVRTPREQHRQIGYAARPFGSVEIDQDADAVAQADGNVALDHKAAVVRANIVRRRQGRLVGRALRVDPWAHDEFDVSAYRHA